MLLLDDAVEHCGYGLDFVEGEAEFHRLFINAVVCLNGEETLGGLAVHQFVLTLHSKVDAAGVFEVVTEKRNGEVGFLG